MTDSKAIADQLKLPSRILISGDWLAAISGRTFQTLDPTTGKVLASLPACGAKDVDAAVSSARAAFESGVWSALHPTELVDVTLDMEIFPQERFGPSVAIARAETDEEAIDLANATACGLAATRYTRDVAKARTFARRREAGTVAANTYCEGDISTPYRSVKASGLGGRDNGVHAHEQHTDRKTIWIELVS